MDVTAIRAVRYGIDAPLRVAADVVAITMAIKACTEVSDHSNAITSMTTIGTSIASFMRKKLRHESNTRKIASWP
jgi:hypothetical protein